MRRLEIDSTEIQISEVLEQKLMIILISLHHWIELATRVQAPLQNGLEEAMRANLNGYGVGRNMLQRLLE